MKWYWNPLKNLNNKDVNISEASQSLRPLVTTFWQKVVDAFDVLGGNNGFIYQISRPGSRFPIHLNIAHRDNFENKIKMGIMDYLPPIFLIKLLMRSAFRLFEFGADTLPFGYGLTLFIIPRYIIAGAAFAIGSVLALFFSVIQLLLTSILTLLSLPVIAVVHACSQNKKEALENDFVTKYKEQSGSNPLPVIQLDNTTCKPGTMENIISTLAGNYAEHYRSADLRRRPARLVLFQTKFNPPGTLNQNCFYQFNYSRKGMAAFQALRKISKRFCDDHSEDYKSVVDMLFAFSTFAQMSRDTKHPYRLPIEMAQEIAIRVMDASEGLSLEDRRLILKDMREALRELQIKREQSKPSSARIEEIKDDDPKFSP